VTAWWSEVTAWWSDYLLCHGGLGFSFAERRLVNEGMVQVQRCVGLKV